MSILASGSAHAGVSSVSASPNPFANALPQSTTISYTLGNTSLLWLRIFDSSGNVKRQLISPASYTTTNITSGAKNQVWDGKNDSSILVGNGNYNYKFDSIYYVSTGSTNREPEDVVVNPSNSTIVWASSVQDSCLYKSTNSGSSWSCSSFPGNSPRGMAITSDGNTIWVANGSSVYRTTNAGTNWSTVNWTGISSAWDMAVTADGSVAYGTERTGSKVFRYAAGAWSQVSTPSGASSLRGIAVHPTNSAIVYVADSVANKVWKSTDSGSSWTQFATQGTTSSTYNTPYDVEVDSNGNVWVSDINYHRMQEFDSSGNWMTTLGGTGTGTGSYSFDSGGTSLGVHPVTISGQPILFVADWNNKQVKKYNYENWSSSTDIVVSNAVTTTTTLGTGTDPGNATLAPGGAATMADAFTFQTGSGTDTIVSITATLAAGSYAGISLLEITNSAGTTVYGSVSNPTSDTPNIGLATAITATTTLTTYKIRITPKTHANMPAPPGASYAVTAYVSGFESFQNHAGSDTAGTTVTIDNLSPADVTASTASAGNGQVALAWTNPADADFHSVIVLRRTTTDVTDTPTEGSTYIVGNTIGSSTVACVVAKPGTSCNDTGRTNGTAYYYKVFTKDSNGNYSAGVVPTGSPATPGLTTLATGTDPGNASLAPGGAATMVDAFTLGTASFTGNDTVSAVTVTLAAGTSAGLSLVEITNSAGTTVYGSVTNPGSDTPSITLSTPITVTSTTTTYKIRITPKTHANMPVPAGASYAVTARITAFTNTRGQTGTDSASSTVTIDNLSPGNATSSAASVGDYSQRVDLSWVNPADTDKHSIIVLRRTGGAVTDTPVEGTTYVAGNTIGSSTVACVVASPVTTCADTGLTNGTAYYYKIFVKDTNGNYSTGVVPTGSPATPIVPVDVTPPGDTIDLVVTAETSTSLTLSWTAPGDDGYVAGNPATTYDIRYSTSPITSGNWASATQATGEPAPQVAGTAETFIVTGLPANTTYYFAMKTSDEVPNTSGLSNLAVGTTNSNGTNATYYWDSSNAASVATGITTNWGSCGTQPSSTKITLMKTAWGCSSDRSELTANGTYFDMYYNTALTQDTIVTGGTFKVQGEDKNWGGFTVSAQLFYVSPSGTQTFIGTAATANVGNGAVTDLTINLSGQSATVPSGYKLALRVATTAGTSNQRRLNLGSGIGSGFGGTLTDTETPAGDITAPAAVTLSTSTITDTSVKLTWTAPGDDNNTGTAKTYDVRYSTSAITDAATWNAATKIGGEPTPAVAGTTTENFTVTGLSPATTYYFAIKTGDEVPNWSAVSNSPSATTYERPVGGYTDDNVIPAAQVTQATDGSGLMTITWKGRDGQAQNVTLKTFQYSIDGGSTWNAPTNGDASAALSANWNNNGSSWTTATTFGAATAHSFTFNTKHANVTGINGTDQSDIRVRFTLTDSTSMDSTLPATSENFRVDDLAPTSTITSAAYDASTDTMTITGTNFLTIDISGTDIKNYVNWTKFVWDINGDGATTPDITFVVGDVTSLTITSDTTLTLQFSAAKGTAIEGTAGYGYTGGADHLDVTAGFIKDYYGNAATTDAATGVPLITAQILGTVYQVDEGTPVGSGHTVRLVVNGTSVGTTTTDTYGAYSIWASLSAGDAVLAYIDNDATYTGTTVTIASGTGIAGFNIYDDHVIVRQDNGGSLTNANMSTAKGAYVDTDIHYSVSGGALTLSGSTTELHVPASHTFAPGGNVTAPTIVVYGTFTGGSGSITVNGNLENLGTFTATSGTTTVSGDFNNGGTFTASGGTVTFNGTAQSIFGSTTFNNLTKTVAAADNFYFEAGSTTTVTGTATLQGASGQLLYLKSSNPGTYWNFVLGAASTKAISYVNVSDSDASGSNAAKKPVNPTNSSDGGHNISWFVPTLTFLKTVAVTSDPVNGATNPKNIPGAEVLYTMRVTNSGTGGVDNNSLVITDPIPANTEVFTGDLSGGAPFAFSDGAPTSGLSCGFTALNNLADCMDFSNDNGASWTYVPNGSFDPAVTNIRFSLSGAMNANTGSGSPYFNLNFRVRVK